LSDDGQLLGEVLEADEVACRGAEAVTDLAVREWDEAYRSLALALGEVDLAAAVRAAVAPPPPSERSPPIPPGGGDDVLVAEVDDSSSKDTWKPHDGWWVERPLRRRAVASCGTLPKPYVVLSLDGTPLLSSEAPGLHLAAVSATGEVCPAPESLLLWSRPDGGTCGGEDGCDSGAEAAASAVTSFAAAAATAWAAAVPEGATVLLAAVFAKGSQPSALAPFLAALAEGGLGCPTGPPPPGYMALAAVGRKGGGKWTQTHAAADIALATVVVRP